MKKLGSLPGFLREDLDVNLYDDVGAVPYEGFNNSLSACREVLSQNNASDLGDHLSDGPQVVVFHVLECDRPNCVKVRRIKGDVEIAYVAQ